MHMLLTSYNFVHTVLLHIHTLSIRPLKRHSLAKMSYAEVRNAVNLGQIVCLGKLREFAHAIEFSVHVKSYQTDVVDRRGMIPCVGAERCIAFASSIRALSISYVADAKLEIILRTYVRTYYTAG